MEIAQEQAATSRAMARSTINAERAWILGELGGDAFGSMNVVESTSQTQRGRSETTNARLVLTCKNEGRTPAWIDNIYGHMEILARQSDIKGRGNRHDGQTFGVMGPLGAGKKRVRSLDLTCSGRLQEGNVLSVYVLVQYRDIFNFTRETYLAYSIFDSKNIYQQPLPERNRNT